MQRIGKLINFFVLETEKKNILGRWSINSCYTVINKNIDSGNIDHCGPCGEKSLTKDTDKILDTDKNLNTNLNYSKVK